MLKNTYFLMVRAFIIQYLGSTQPSIKLNKARFQRIVKILCKKRFQY